MLKTVSSITNAIGALNYKGTWNASTNTPALASGVGTKGDYYVVSVAGSTTLDGVSTWGVGDWAAFNGTAWQRVDGGADGEFVNLSATGSVSFDGGEFVFNESGGDFDFRVESDTNTALLFTDASTDRIGIGTSSPTYKLDVVGGIHADALTAQGSADSYADGLGLMMYYATNVGYLRAYNNNSGTGTASIAMITAGLERLRIDSSGNVGIGTSSPTNALSVTGNANITGNTTLGDASTDTVTVYGYMGVGGGGAANSSRAINVESITLTGTGQTGVYSSITGNSSATASVRGFSALVSTAASAFTVTDVAGFWYVGIGKGAGSTITNAHGLYIADQTQGTNNFGITSQVSSGTDKWNIYASGTAANYFAGNVGIGTSSPSEKFEVNGNIKTAAPSGGTAAAWKLGTVASVSPTSPDRTIEVEIGGTTYYLHAKTTND